MNDDDFKELASPALKQLVVKLRYMGNQYAAGQSARGGGQQKHYLQEAADELERLFAESVSRGQEVADLRNVVQVACIDGMPGLARAWEKYFPDHPITINGAGAYMDDADAKRLYSAHAGNHPTIHCNRFPSWEELSEQSRQEWRDKAKDTPGVTGGGDAQP